jgi:flagellar basal-body rod protein FlgC
MSDGLFTGFSVCATGMSAQRRRLDVIAENLANVETTRTPEGGPYRRQIPVLQSQPVTSAQLSRNRDFLNLIKTNIHHMSEIEMPLRAAGSSFEGVETTVQQDSRPFRVEYDPGHPDANEEGYVLKPNVSVIEEMTEMIKATRAYQANAAALEAAKEMFNVSLQI